jgi:hypothetical protein
MWREANLDRQNFASKHFASFLPNNLDKTPIGAVWHLIPRNERDKIDETTPDMHLSANRFYPPEPSPNEMILFKILQMLHKRPFIRSRFPPRGTSLTLRARNKDYVDIIFRFENSG